MPTLALQIYSVDFPAVPGAFFTNYLHMKLILSLIIFSFLATTIFSQTKISGKVTDINNQPLPGANIFLFLSSHSNVSVFRIMLSLEMSSTLLIALILFVSLKIIPLSDVSEDE